MNELCVDIVCITMCVCVLAYSNKLKVENMHTYVASYQKPLRKFSTFCEFMEVFPNY